MTNRSRVKAAQTRAKSLIEKYNKLGWEIKPSIIERANAEVPKNISARKAQAMIDNLSASTIRTTMTMKSRLTIEETTPIEKGNYKSGAKIYDVIHMDAPTIRRKDVEFTPRNIVDKVMGEIEFIMKNAPNKDVAAAIENRLWAIELHSDKKIFDTEDKNMRIANLLPSIKGKKSIESAVKKAEESGYPATQALTTLYEDLVGEYGINERGLAARQMRQFENVKEIVGVRYSPGNIKEQIVIADVLTWLIENDSIWNEYRREFKLKKVGTVSYDSDSLLNDVSDAIVDNPKYRIEILQYLIELMGKKTNPSDILSKIDEYVKKLAEQEK